MDLTTNILHLQIANIKNDFMKRIREFEASSGLHNVQILSRILLQKLSIEKLIHCKEIAVKYSIARWMWFIKFTPIGISC